MYELYSQRIKDVNGEPEVYIYDSFSQKFRNQAFYALSDSLDYFNNEYRDSDTWEDIHNLFVREKGIKSLCGASRQDAYKWNVEYYVGVSDDVDFLDLLDFSFHYIHILGTYLVEEGYAREFPIQATKSIDELNNRFRQNNLGYEFVNGSIIRKDNEFTHAEIIKPALKLLVDSGFEGAEEEFMAAFKCRRTGDNKGVINNANKAFESTMKTICSRNGYIYNKNATAKELISLLETNHFYPSYMNCYMSSLRSSLESGLPTVRNKEAGHGQGEEIIEVPDEFAEYALNLAATNILLLMKIFRSKQKEENPDGD